MTVDPERLERRLRGLQWTLALLQRTSARTAHWDCFGLHEWAMAYRPASGLRHEQLPLRLGQEGTDAVVESHQLKCTHADAFRFFTAAAVDRNDPQPTRERQLALEQPGCLHANMDLYRLAFRMLPFIEASIVLDAFELARDIRELDMRASPYDLSEFGYSPVHIETPDGKAEYVRAQRGFAERAAPLRAQLSDAAESLMDRVGEAAA